MIIDLNLRGKTVIVIGGGNEAQKRINSLVKQGCEIIVISDSVNSQINKLAKIKKIKLKKQKIQDTKFISKYKPNMVITTTTDSKLNQVLNISSTMKLAEHICRKVLYENKDVDENFTEGEGKVYQHGKNYNGYSIYFGGAYTLSENANYNPIVTPKHLMHVIDDLLFLSE